MGNREIRGTEVCLNKVRYDTKVSAVESFRGYIRNIPRKRGRKTKKIRHEQHPYKCEFCKGWHLTRRK